MTDSAEVNRKIAERIHIEYLKGPAIRGIQSWIVEALDQKDLAYKKLVEAAKKLLHFENDCFFGDKGCNCVFCDLMAALAEIEGK
jgi:hypothetical protein